MSDIKIDPDEGLFGRQSKQMTKTGKAKDKKKNRKRKRSRKDKQEEAQLESLLFGDVQDDDHPSHSSTALFAQVQQDFSNDEIIISPNRNDNASMYEYDSSAHSSSIVGLGGEELVDSDEDSDQDLLDLNDNKNNINNHSFGASAYDDVFGATDANDKENEVGDKAAWVDEDDENLRINISKENRLRKLRNDEGETVISGTELTKRLRDRFQSMNNKALDWAEIKGKGIHANTKKRKVHDSDDSDDSNSDSGSDSDSEVEGDTEFLYNTQSLTTSSDQLPAGKVDISRVKDANMAAPSQGVVTSVEFHQNGQLVMTAGMDKTVRLFQVDGLRNVKVQGVHLKDLPIYQAQFTNDGRSIVASGRRKYFYSIDVVSGSVDRIHGIRGRSEKSLERFAISPNDDYISFIGKDGYIVSCHANSKQWCFNLKMNGQGRSVSYSKENPNHLFSFSEQGMVYLWDVRTRKCITQHMDHGCVHGTSLAVSEDSSMYATGSDSGIVNVYSMDGLKRDIDRIDDGTETALSHLPSSSSSNGNASSLSHLPSFSSVSSYHSPVQQSYSKQPLKILTNLTTPVDYIRFNPDSQLMAFASRRKKDALKLLHVPSMTVFSNWPTMQTPLHYVSSVAFSPNSGYLAVGNDRGRVLLYRLKHYPSS